MPTVRYLVLDVDAVLPFYEALGFALADRWGPPFAIVERDGPDDIPPKLAARATPRGGSARLGRPGAR